MPRCSAVIASSSARYGAGSNGASRSETSRHSSFGNEMKRTRGSRFLSRSLPVTASASPFLPWNPSRVARMRSRAGSTASEAQSAFWIASDPDAAHMIWSRRLPPGPGLQVRDEPPHGVRLDPGNRVVGGQRDRFEVARPVRGLEPAHVAQESSLPFDRVVTEVRDEHARRVVVQLAAVGGPVEDAGALGDRQLRGRVGAERHRLALRRSRAGWRSTGSLRDVQSPW